MSTNYPSGLDIFPERINYDSNGNQILSETHTVVYSLSEDATPVAEYYVVLDHVPETEGILVSGFSESETYPPASGYFYAELSTDATPTPTQRLMFNSEDFGLNVSCSYTTLGDKIMAEDVNDIQDAIESIMAELGINPKGTFASVVARLNWVTGMFNKDSGHSHNGFDSPKINMSFIQGASISNVHVATGAAIAQTKIANANFDEEWSGTPENLYDNLCQLATRIKALEDA
jgi:hypothetical protein